MNLEDFKKEFEQNKNLFKNKVEYVSDYFSYVNLDEELSNINASSDEMETIRGNLPYLFTIQEGEEYSDKKMTDLLVTKVSFSSPINIYYVYRKIGTLLKMSKILSNKNIITNGIKILSDLIDTNVRYEIETKSNLYNFRLDFSYDSITPYYLADCRYDIEEPTDLQYELLFIFYRISQTYVAHLAKEKEIFLDIQDRQTRGKNVLLRAITGK